MSGVANTTHYLLLTQYTQGKVRGPALAKAMEEARSKGKTPFFVGSTAGTTVRGSFDALDEIQDVIDACDEKVSGSKLRNEELRDCVLGRSTGSSDTSVRNTPAGNSNAMLIADLASR